MTVMRSVLKRTAAIAASIGLMASSTAAVAAAPAPAPAAYQAPSAWMMLSALSPSGATVLGSANGAAQPAEVPPPPPPGPPPPPPVAGAMADGVGELIPIVLWFGLIAVALTITDKEGLNQATGSPNSAP
jgi:hypothetical protein